MTTIRQQLTRKLLLAMGLLIGAGGVAVFFCARAALQAQFDAALQAKAQALTALTEQKNSGIEIDFSDEHMRGFEANGSDFFELRWPDGRTVKRSPSLRDTHLPIGHGTVEAPAFWNITLPDVAPARAIGIKFRPHPDGKDVVPSDAILVIASVRRDLDRTLATLQLVLGGCGLLLLAGTALVVPRLLRRELAPLQQLAAAAARIDASSLSTRFPTVNLPGELAPITARLNELLARLEDSFDRERRFSSDVAHEFRTPISELRSLAELAIKLPDTRAANADQEVLSIALHLESVLTHLLTLSRGERGDLQTQRQPVALAPLIEDVCRKFKARAAGRQLTFQWQAAAQTEITSDPVLLRSILTNLVDNAVEYTPRGGSVEVEASMDHGCFTLRVINTVENLEAHDLPYLFDRFWRKDTARSNDGHTGLGLSLARTLAHTIGCELTARFIAPKRLAMTLMEAEMTAPSNAPADTN
jgi:signal transduction histidine kinase